MEKNKILICMEDGVIQNIYTTDKNADIAVIDYDDNYECSNKDLIDFAEEQTFISNKYKYIDYNGGKIPVNIIE